MQPQTPQSGPLSGRGGTQSHPCAADLLSFWDPASRATPQARLDKFLTGIAPADAAQDTLGARNQRMLAAHRALVGGGIDAQVTCRTCQTVNAFALPLAAIAGAPVPGPDVIGTVRRGDTILTFRLPRQADLAAGDPVAVLHRCYGGASPFPDLSPTEVADLTRQFEHLDPAAVIETDLTCAGCAGSIRASVDLARFVARDFDIAADALLHEIDTIARTYGWTEPDILALPASRRRRYVELIRRATASSPDRSLLQADRPRPVVMGRRG